MSGFQKAERKRVYLKCAVTGPSGSGKTMSALRMAFGLGKNVAVIDTENDSASLYADKGDFDTMVLSAPFTVQKYIAGIQAAHNAGYDVLIIDSLTHEWAGDGGLLDQKSAKDSHNKNGFSNWAEISKLHEQLKSAILQTPLHIICTMRSKQEYVQEANEQGRQVIKKVGMAPIQREGMEYEFTVVWDLCMDHTAMISKDRTGLFDGETGLLTEAHGKRLLEWLSGGVAPPPPKLSIKEQIAARVKEIGWEGAVKPLITAMIGEEPQAWNTEVYTAALENWTVEDWRFAMKKADPFNSEETPSEQGQPGQPELITVPGGAIEASPDNVKAFQR